jgi:hypothetical protein
MYVVRNALTGFRSGWQHHLTGKSTAVSSTFGISSDMEPAQVDRLDYAADDSEDDTKEATMSMRKPTKDNEHSKVCLTEFYPNK